MNLRTSLYSSNFKIFRSLNNIYVFSFDLSIFELFTNLATSFLRNKNISFILQDLRYFSFFKGFEFFGWHFFKSTSYKNVVRISDYNIKIHKLSLRNIIKSSVFSNISFLIDLLNKEISIWNSFYNFTGYLSDVYNELDMYIYKLLWNLLKRRHPRRPNTWIYSKYWKYINGRWIFCLFDCLTGKNLFLKSHSYYNSKTYYLPSSLYVFDFYNQKRLQNIYNKKLVFGMNDVFYIIWKKQLGLCFVCKRLFEFCDRNNTKISLINFNKKSNKISNFALLHTYCFIFT